MTGLTATERQETKERTKMDSSLSDEEVVLVESHLPNQPWEPGTHRKVAVATGLNVAKVQKAIKKLIASGKRHEQRDGILYDVDGNEIPSEK